MHYDPKPAKPTTGICVDASCMQVRDSIKRDGFYHGALEWQILALPNLTPIHASPVYPHANINLGEFVAIVDAMRILKARGDKTTTVYSDSLTAIAWYKNKRVKSRHPRNEKTAHILDTVARALQWVKEVNPPNPVVFWDKVIWDENPADFGRK